MLKVSFFILFLSLSSVAFSESTLTTEEGFFKVCEKYKTPEMIEFWKECQKLQINKLDNEVKWRLRENYENRSN